MRTVKQVWIWYQSVADPNIRLGRNVTCFPESNVYFFVREGVKFYSQTEWGDRAGFDPLDPPLVQCNECKVSIMLILGVLLCMLWFWQEISEPGKASSSGIRPFWSSLLSKKCNCITELL